MAIILNNVSKYYHHQKALDQINLEFRDGEICGFLGPNGAGKSTTMKIITGYITDYEGEVYICGMDSRKNPLEVKRILGYLPEHNPLYPEMYIREYLLHIAKLYHISQAGKKVDEIVELTGLQPEIRKKIGQLSKGYRQRVGLAQALVHDPQLLILDEPMTGLDPNQLEEIRHLIVNIARHKTVLLSTHIMQEVEAICDRVVIIDRGKIVTDKNIREIQALTENGMVLSVRFAPGSHTDWLAESGLFTTVRPLAPEYWQVSFTPGEDKRIELFNLAALHQCPIIELKYEEHKLEDIFRQLTHTK